MASTLSLLVVCVLFAVIEARVIKTDRVEVPPEGLTIKIVIKPDADGKMKVQVKSVDKKRKMGTDDRRKVDGVIPLSTKLDKVPADLPIIEDRFGIVVGNCPEGYASKSGFCFPDYDN